MLKDLITPKASTDPDRLIKFFTPKVSADPRWKLTRIYSTSGSVDPEVLFPAYPKVHTNPGFGYLTEKLFILKNIINIHCVKISTYNKHKNEQLDKKPAIFCFRQVVDSLEVVRVCTDPWNVRKS
jgi:hypothetical protein